MARIVDSTTTIVLVTGANQGIGLETSKRLATEQPNYHIVMAGRRQQAIEEAAATLKKLGHSVEPLVMDVTSDASIADAAQFVSEKFGRLDVLINNAGILRRDLPEGREKMRLIYETNVFGPMVVTEAFLPLLERATGTKRLVYVTSTLGSIQVKLDQDSKEHPLHGLAYSTSKSALNMLALHYSVKYEKDPSWKFNLSCPGFCNTNLNEYRGPDTPENGSINICRLATLGPDGESGTFTDRHGTIPW
ncbi:hypothetical protein FDECE_12949 [Fusarium decemcellulare]|nr:hypothetical protein FDECE_12949 [Fusarium decemcellulare]